MQPIRYSAKNPWAVLLHIYLSMQNQKILKIFLALFLMFSAKALAENDHDMTEEEFNLIVINQKAIGDYFNTNDPKKLELSFETSLLACEKFNSTQACDDMVNSALRHPTISAKLMQRSVDLLEKRCSESSEMCVPLGGALKELGRSEEALSLYIFACKQKHASGCSQAALVLSEKDLNSFAGKYALEACTIDRSECDFALRYYPSFIDQKFVIDQVEASCSEQKRKGIGATECAILGTYYFSRGNLEHAMRVLGNDCDDGNDTSCTLKFAMMLKDNREEEGFEQVKVICDRTPEMSTGNSAFFRGTVCKSKSSRMPASSVADSAINTLEDFLREQK